MRTREELIKGLEEELNSRTKIDDLKYIVKQPNGRIAAIFLRKWEAEKFIEASGSHDYKLVIK